MNARARKTVAVLCVAAVVFTAFLPLVSSNVLPVLLTALWLVVPAVGAVVMRRKALRCDEQPASLRSLLPAREPPLSLHFA